VNLLEVLEVEQDKLPHQTRRAAYYCAERWVEAGKPTEPAALADFLDGALKFCQEVEFRYPKILLKRLKQLQRGEWMPRVEGTERRPPRSLAPVREWLQDGDEGKGFPGGGW